eukprot:3496397-Alexandrium_andersonii.AAC.1
MSASLVGSEMCIRDSPGVRPCAGAALAASAAGRLPVPPRGAVAAHRGGAVSYTHLTLPTICSV